jgi:ribosomal protein S18 acetylase RimI-like enzyme
MSLLPIELAGPKVAAELETSLLSDLRQSLPQSRNEAITLSVISSDGSLVAGLAGSTSYGWLLIKVLWVKPELRRQGYGRALVTNAFVRARSIGCHGSWLDTSNEPAQHFYASLGFKVFGVLQNQGADIPKCHKRWFMSRSI